MGSTHDWAVPTDIDHMRLIRADPARFAAGGVGHLVLEVVAYAVDEAVAGTTDQVRVVLHADGSIVVDDNGRGTQVRYDDTGTPTVKPIMGTRDLRFFAMQDAPLLPDGQPRSGISVVAALSQWLTHTNRRDDRGWWQRYERGRPTGPLIELGGVQRPGTTVHFLPDPAVFGHQAPDVAALRTWCDSWRGVVDVTVTAEGLSGS